MNRTYWIWRRSTCPTLGRWIKTTQSVTALTDRQAQSKMERRFRRSGFTGMQLVAILEGEDPNPVPQTE